MNFANDFADKNGFLTVNFISQRGIVRRSDAFLLDVDGDVVLLDAGLPEVPYAMASLLQLRAKYLMGHEELLENKSVKLKITWIVSHMHIDHIGAFLSDIGSSPYIFVEKAYLPPSTQYYDEVLSKDWDGDYKYRAIVKNIFEQYQPVCEIINIPFSSSEIFAFNKCGVMFTILPPTKDWGIPEYVEYSKEMYSKDAPHSLPVSIVNSNSMWLLVEYKKVRFLFTGDSMKKTNRNDESFDVMLHNWKTNIGNIDVMKYPHHGIYRDPASVSIVEMRPKFLIFNAIDATAQAKIREIDSKIEKDTSFISTCYEDAIFTVDKEGNLVFLSK